MSHCTCRDISLNNLTSLPERLFANTSSLQTMYDLSVLVVDTSVTVVVVDDIALVVLLVVVNVSLQ
jgi:hypothetical protein